MKRTGKLALSVVVCALFVMAAFAPTALVLSTSATAEAAESNTLVVYNWADYIDEDLIAEFEEEYGITVTYSTFDTNETMLTTVEQGNEQIDLICPSEYAIQRLMQGGYLQKIDTSKLSTYSNVDQRIYDKVNSVFTGISVPGAGNSESMSDYFVPYMWGTLGILYNTDVVTEADIAKGYGILWNKAENEALDGKILMKDSVRDSYVAAVLYMKECGTLPEGKYADLSIQELINTIDDTLIEAAENVFVEQKERGGGFEVDEGKNDMINGDAYVSLQWSGDALYTMEQADNLDYFVPVIGGNIWFDGWVIPKNAPNYENALKFIDFLNRPEVAMANAMYIGYTSAVSPEVLQNSQAAMNVLVENEYEAAEYFGDLNRYPVIDDAKYGVMKDFGEYNDDAIAMWERVKKPDLMWILWVVIAVVAAAAIGVGIYFIVRKKGSVRKVVKATPSGSAALYADKAANDSDDDSDDDEEEAEDGSESGSDSDSENKKEDAKEDK